MDAARKYFQNLGIRVLVISEEWDRQGSALACLGYGVASRECWVDGNGCCQNDATITCHRGTVRNGMSNLVIGAHLLFFIHVIVYGSTTVPLLSDI